MEELKKQMEYLYKQKKYKDALRLAQDMEKKEPNDFDVLKAKTALLGLLNKNDEAISVSDLALSINSEDYQLLHMKAVSLYYLKKYEEALAIFDQCLEHNPSFHRAINKKINILMLLGRFIEAEKLYRESDLPEIDNEIPFNNLGYLYLQLGYFNKAEKFLHKAKEFNKFNPTIYYNLLKINKHKREISNYLKNSILLFILKIIDIVGVEKLLFRFTPSNNFQDKEEKFKGSGKLFNTDNQEQETKAILKILRNPYITNALCNDWWDWFAVNVPYDALEKNGFKGDIDILLKRPTHPEAYYGGFTYRAFEVKVTKVNKNGEIKSGLHRGKGQLRKLKLKLNLLKKFGCELVFFLEIFILERGYSKKFTFPSDEIEKEIMNKAEELKSLGVGYVVCVDEPSVTHDDESGGQLYFPNNVLSTQKNEIKDDFRKMVSKITETKKRLLDSNHENKKI